MRLTADLFGGFTKPLGYRGAVPIDPWTTQNVYDFHFISPDVVLP